MASLKEIRVRIISVRSTQKITSAMKMVSAAKLRRAQTTIIKFRPYAKNLTNLLNNVISSRTEDKKNPLEEIRKEENVLIVMITSNKGLCGGFNNNVIKLTESLLQSTYQTQHQQNKVKFICIGRKANEYLQRKKYPIYSIHNDILDTCTFEKVAAIAENIMQQFIDKKIDKVEIVYSRFKNAGTQLFVNQSYLPIAFDENENQASNTDYIFEPDKEQLYEQMIPLFIKTKLYQAVLESLASEHGARMTAMHKATENANDLIKELNLTYNKLRQASITNALIEMVSAAESLNTN
ncbi:MAG TPA: ATP synthase F1 subunit gamma [Bacteroidales bacterium]|nr:ATP synthase F1 subunit gamma [Bacteroidales bacterium]HOR81213.1 ATP synthase F1 subunit gamma [Bacteroidales bacterium]HPJ90480.1 ATP synthase F1 subunit gamma [Bacteroidales bacterium]